MEFNVSWSIRLTFVEFDVGRGNMKIWRFGILDFLFFLSNAKNDSLIKSVDIYVLNKSIYIFETHIRWYIWMIYF